MLRRSPYLSLPPVPDTTITRADVVFPAQVQHLMPRPEDIPQDYSRSREWKRFQAEWFFKGLDVKKIKAKPGVDLTQALAHLSCIQGSYEPKHQHKVASVAWLASQWLDESSLDALGE